MTQEGRRVQRRRRRRRQRIRRLCLLAAVVLVILAAALLIWQPWGKDEPKEDPAGQTETPETPDPGTEEPEEPEQPENPIDKTAWNLLLVNPWNPLPENFTVELKDVNASHQVDARCYDDLMEMLEAAQAQGLEPVICSSYRTQNTQQVLFDYAVDQFLNQGLSQEEAEKAAARDTAVPGTSEHQVGLALDIVDVNYQMLDDAQADTPTQQWLMANSWRYGFILRYAKEKTDITGIMYEPWHYRYVGREAAKEIYESGVCLEEYLAQ